MLKTKIVCTIGPSSREPDTLRALIEAGMNVARLNFSHGDQLVHGENIHRIRSASAELNVPVAILVDLQGPKLRIGQLPSEGHLLTPGQEIRLVGDVEPGRLAEQRGAKAEIPLQYAGMPGKVHPGDRILIDDGLLELVVLETSPTDIVCRVVAGGLLLSNKGINLPNAALTIPAITEKDWDDLAFALAAGADWIALSFVRSEKEVETLKQRIAELCDFGRPVPVMAKIEKPEAIDSIDAIIAASDGIMVARGDLGIETAPEKVPMVQKMIIEKCNQAGVPVVTATQMLDSMIRNPRPTRAEASDVANAILDGTDAVMLSGETAAGLYPLESVRTMVSIAREVEASHRGEWVPPDRLRRSVTSVTDAVSHATCETAHDLRAAAIVTATASGRTATAVARYRPACPVIAVTPSPMVQRRLLMVRGVWPLLGKRALSTDAMLDGAIEVCIESGQIRRGDTVVITAGISPNMPGSTDLMKVETVPVIVAEGLGVLDRTVKGRVRRIDRVGDLGPEEVGPQDVLVIAQSDRSLIPYIQRAAGLISAEGGPGCHAQTLALELGIPAVVGVGDAIAHLINGMEVTMDTARGRVYASQVTEPAECGRWD